MGNLIDKAVNFLSPGWGLARARNRALEMIVSGGYEGASTSNAIFQEFLTSTTDADSSFSSWDRKRIIERSRDNIRNVPIASAVINRTCDHSIGDRGLTLHPQVDRQILGMSEDQAIEWQDKTDQEWRLFSESKEVDFYREQNFAEKTYLTLKSELEGGDCATIFLNVKRPGSPYGLKLQSLEGEFISNPDYKQDTESLIQGIEKDKSGIPVAYHFSKRHPGDRLELSAEDWQRRKIFDSKGRRNILLHKNQIRFGQTRGVPILGPVTGKLLQIGRLSKAELLASVLNSYYTLVVTGKQGDTLPVKTSPAEQNSTLTVDDKLTMGSGSFIRAKEGTEVKSFDPARPNVKFEPFFMTMVAEIGAAVGVPKSLIMMLFDKSYSASRGEVLLAWIYFLAKRTHVAVGLCQPTYEAFLDEAVALGRISAPGYFQNEIFRKAYQGSPYNQWTGPTRPAIDELKEARAHALYNSIGTQSLQEITTKTTGRSWQKVNEQIIREHNLRVGAGLETEVDIA